MSAWQLRQPGPPPFVGGARPPELLWPPRPPQRRQAFAGLPVCLSHPCRPSAPPPQPFNATLLPKHPGLAAFISPSSSSPCQKQAGRHLSVSCLGKEAEKGPASGPISCLEPWRPVILHLALGFVLVVPGSADSAASGGPEDLTYIARMTPDSLSAVRWTSHRLYTVPDAYSLLTISLARGILRLHKGTVISSHVPRLFLVSIRPISSADVTTRRV